MMLLVYQGFPMGCWGLLGVRDQVSADPDTRFLIPDTRPPTPELTLHHPRRTMGVERTTVRDEEYRDHGLEAGPRSLISDPKRRSLIMARQARKKILVVEDDRPLRHTLCQLLRCAGFTLTGAPDGVSALRELSRKTFDVVLLDLGLPRVNGLEVLAQIRKKKSPPRVVVMTADNAPETLLYAVREQACQYVTKPVSPKSIVEVVERVLAAPALSQPIEVVSARPEWVELLVPCELAAAERIQSFLQMLDADLPDEIRKSVGTAFRELLLNAIEWGGQLDPTRKVRIAYLRARRMLLYRIADPGPGFHPDDLAHAAVSNQPDHPLKHMSVREEKGLRPGGFGLLMTRAMVDELIHNEAHNEVVFIKYLD